MILFAISLSTMTLSAMPLSSKPPSTPPSAPYPLEQQSTDIAVTNRDVQIMALRNMRPVYLADREQIVALESSKSELSNWNFQIENH